MTTPFDAGLQPERTALAWRRTSLALLAGSLIAARILPELFGPWSALVGIAGAATAAALLAATHHRYRAHHEALHQYGDRVPSPTDASSPPWPSSRPPQPFSASQQSSTSACGGEQGRSRPQTTSLRSVKDRRHVSSK
ncbi:DUF202 domain-containing protein [Leifsonia xyli]|uniref:DUF202 domain-containing protein n=1 Tax=Leifsonia xyli TaxID=1575 RepID=UPI003D677D54